MNWGITVYFCTSITAWFSERGGNLFWRVRTGVKRMCTDAYVYTCGGVDLKRVIKVKMKISLIPQSHRDKQEAIL